MGAGRFVCVALPLGLTLASLVCILIACLAGVTNKGLDMFDVKTQNLSISSSALTDLAGLTRRADHFSALTIAALTPNVADTSGNITAADLGLADSYQVSLWNYCSTTGTNTTCTKAAFNWASSALNTTSIENLVDSSGQTYKLPKDITDALKTFAVVSKWTEVIYIVAFVATAVELIFGCFAICSRVGSCLTYIISGISTVAIIGASVMATVGSSLVVGAIKSATKIYGVQASLNLSFLAITWLAAAFSLAGGLFWLFTICCCASDHHSNRAANRRSRDGEAEKMYPHPTGAYQRVEDPYMVGGNGMGYAGQQQGITGPQGQPAYAIPTNNKPLRGSGAYEPYSHTAI